MDCNFCEGVAHPATGCYYGPKTMACGPCTRRFWAWFEQHSNPRPILNRCEESPGKLFLLFMKHEPTNASIAWCHMNCFTAKAQNRRCCMSAATLRCTRPKKKVVSFYAPGPG